MSRTLSSNSSSAAGSRGCESDATYYAVTVDTEEEWEWNSGWPREESRVETIRFLPEFQEVCTRHRAATTYFTNHAVLDNESAWRILSTVASEPAVEIGLHIHPWNTPPYANDAISTARQSFIANLPATLIRAKLETVYQRCMDRGVHPTSFRGGRYSSGRDVQNFLVEHGFLVDSSVVPYTTWPDDGAPDYRNRGVFPVRRNLESGKSLWEIPLTMGFTRQPFGFWARCYGAVANSVLRHLRIIGIADRLNLVRRVWLSFEDPLGVNMLQFLHQLRRCKLPCVVFSLHSSSLQAGANGCYSQTESDRQRLFAQLDEVLAVLSDWPEFHPATMSEIAFHLESQYARSRN